MTFAPRTTRFARTWSSAAGLALAALVVAPGIAVAEQDLPPAPVVPGFENVVIAERPLSGPCLPAPTTLPSGSATTITSNAATRPATAAEKLAKKAAAKKLAAKKAALKKLAAKKAALKKAALKKAATRRAAAQTLQAVRATPSR